ncbi:hypothetical protein DVA67_017665 [Solirubrobacter sp. CPCC 204708]|uniref:Uncharacterized protein n=1 Tax=Solirubrobacter deserti TaxID=2282478 RepID=A0ABT4RCZ0_9ACTN|nr:hypothetical protein [Solirubrobacter deserti]MBE2317814.1 hypothetical protein [Solirubrobacter deserti]MDA0136409.1 hypothetical protein [Solirubrobacter deserti]
MIELPAGDPTVEELADWAELEIMFGDTLGMGTGQLAQLFANAFGDDEPDELRLEQEQLTDDEMEFDERSLREDIRAAAAAGDSPSSRRADDVLRELSFRAQVVGGAYPLSVDGGGIELLRLWDDDPLYAFLALVGARLESGLDIPFHEPAWLFEEIVACALARYVGGTGYRFGWPQKDGEPIEDFVAKARRLSKRLGELPGAMRNVSPAAKDYTLDVVAWRSFADDTPEQPTPGQLVVLCQCGIGKDWAAKSMQVGKWREVIQFSVEPIAALAFPHTPSRVDSELHRWHDVASSPSIPFDRLRIASLLTVEDLPGALIARLRDWIERSLDKLPID